MTWRRILKPGRFYRPVLTVFGDNRPMLGFYFPVEERAQPAPVNGDEAKELWGWGQVTGKPCDVTEGACACGLSHHKKENV